MFTRIAIQRLTPAALSFFRDATPRASTKAAPPSAPITTELPIGELRWVTPTRDQGERDPLTPRVITISLFGPAGAPLLIAQRKLLRGGRGGRLRLGMTQIVAPPGEPARFGLLARGDFLVWGFRGQEDVELATGVLLARAAPADRALFEALTLALAHRDGESMEYPRFENLVRSAAPRLDHPIFELLLDDAMEDAAQNGPGGAARLRARGRTPERIGPLSAATGMSPRELEIAREELRRLERLGRVSVLDWLTSLRGEGVIREVRSTSGRDALAPHDFEVDWPGQPFAHLLVKTTRTSFWNPIHLSLAELRQLASPRTRLLRVFHVGATEVWTRISKDLSRFAQGLLEALAALPRGVSLDTVSVDPARLDWEPDARPIPAA